MASFFRRKKPTDATPGAPGRLDIEALAAAFPQSRPREDADDATLPSAADAIDAARREAVEAVEAPGRDLQPGLAPLDAPHLPASVATAATAFASEQPHAASPAAIAPPAPPPPSAPAAPRADAAPSTIFEALPASALPSLAATEQQRPASATAGKLGWRERLRGSGFARGMAGLFSRNPKLDDDLLDEIETALLLADVGIGATTELVTQLRKRMKAREFADAAALLASLRTQLIDMLRPVAVPLVIDPVARPFVILTVGVNGVGKTTTIGKLAKRYKDEGRSLMLAAGDTFRAAAVAQLQSWGERNGVAVVAQGQNAQGKGGDAASVAFDALQAAKARGMDVLIADTAGRLHTQTGLMDELGKIKRVIGKLDAAAPHEVLMVIDGTTGQNALSQLRQFHAAAGVTGLVVTKLDGSAKGGVVFALAREFGIPIRFAGIGERPEDLRVFDAEAFVDALLPEALGA